MSDYKKTLNLPKTDFPMKANLPQREPVFLKAWQEQDIYNILRQRRKGKKKFILHDGPPYANGHIHVGHAVNKILKDMIVKSKTLSGYDSPYVPGWDCHGLPIELNVEKKHGKAGRKISVDDFRKACREYASSQVAIQKEEFMRLGVIGDWENPYLTMDFVYEANIIRSLAKIVANGHVQKGYKPVHWCLDCSSALAEAEVEYYDKKSPSIDVRFTLVNQDKLLEKINLGTLPSTLSIPVWTTTPWTLPANEAVALNALLQYSIISVQDECLIVAKDLLESVVSRYDIADYEVLAEVAGEQLEGLMLQHPFYDKQVPVILGEHVTTESGTGAVHTAPAHGQEDFIVAKHYQLPVENPVADNGCFKENVPVVSGLHVSKANDVILEELQKSNKLIKFVSINHSYPHCWRHKTPLIFRATPQWFVSMDQAGLREKSLAATKNISWIPGWGLSRIEGLVENRPDWCISRQRTWGVPLAFFVHKETGDLHPDTARLMEEVAKLVEQEGIDAWHHLDAEKLLGGDAENYRKCLDVLDVWFDSGVTHECVLRQREELAYPADIILEGSDQHRGWFQSGLLTSISMNDVASYREALTHGFVVDSKGRKMSKSIGNVIAPEEVIKTLGADILRLWVASVDYRSEIAASNEIFARTAEAYRRIRNTSRFLLANLNGFEPTEHLLKAEDMLSLDRWAVDRARLMQNEILEAFETYQFHKVVQKLHHFCVTDMGAFYLDIIKDRQYTMAENSRGRRSAQTALFHIVNALVRWMAPILSFTAEEIYQCMPGNKQESVQLTEWYADLASLSDNEEMNQLYWEKLRSIRDAVNKEIENQRNLGKIGSALEAEVELYCGAEVKRLLDALGNELRFVLITSSAKVIAEHAGPANTVVTDVAGLALIVKPTKAEKCVRCWHRLDDVGSHADYPDICGRCIENISGEGELREYA